MPKVGKAIVVAGIVALVVAAFNAGGAVAAPRGLVAHVQNATGTELGTVRLIPTEDGKVTVKVNASGLTPGFHGFHVHSIGTCDPAAVDTGGNAVPFFTAGGHYNPDTTMTHGSHAGDMPPLLVMADGTGQLKFKTDRYILKNLMDADGSAIVMHAGPDNLANIPATTSTGGERYHSHVDDVFGADTATKATGDAGARFGCGVIEKF